MVKLRKKEIKDGIIYYYYQIEGKGEWGELFINTNNGQNGWNILAEGDVEWFDNWRQHAYYRMREYVKENNYPETDMVAWG
ncbi:MAG: hypothetical protein K2O31_07290 [Clostridia bacterium]|nr:hypothetical protein [Clostridia bacterium]MDE7209670.1 hypothetical protein [Clostridia bacterium]